MSEKNLFTSRMGFVLAAAGSAVGLGNIWRFPYLAAEYGGGIFLLTYVVLVLTVGFTLMLTEITLGRMTGKSAFTAFGFLNQKWKYFGFFAILASVIILPYYVVVGGWVMQYAASFLTGFGSVTAGTGFFASYISGFTPLIWTYVFAAIGAGIVLFGVKKGIERFCRILLPILIVMLIALSVYCILLPGGLEGLAFYLYPDFSKFSVDLVLAALGQMFYSLTLGIGVMITYGSYLSKKEDIVQSVHTVELFDTGVAFLSGLLIVPAVFIFSGGNPSSLGDGPGLMFVALPKVFSGIPFGDCIGAAFFLMVFFAALTSCVSLYEVIASSLMERFSLGRRAAVGIVLLFTVAVSTVVTLGYSIFDFITINGMTILDMMDFFGNSIVIPLVAIFTCIFAGWVIRPEVILAEAAVGGRLMKRQKYFVVMLKYVVPLAIAAILITNLL